MSHSHDGGDDETSATTIRRHSWPCLRQFCVFLENRVGRLNDLMRHLETIDVQVLSVSIVDSVDFANVRLVFDNPDRAREKLKLSSFLFSESDVIAVELPDDPMPMSSVCSALVKAEVNIHHANVLRTQRRGRAAVVMYVDDTDAAVKALEEQGHRVLREDDLHRDSDFSG
jgi:hypothetical protein